MHFVKLRLSGFKSFVDTTELLIEPGLTGVIGPNGCGKSNLLEALRWVMGETSAKSMRGSGMEDVIFAGAATRPPRNYAEVALGIDNTERRAPAGFNETDELEIVRRIANGLGSTYRHNGKEIRARDVQTLFADASTGANSPSLVRQGQISELINAKPKSRKRILEEAAGIGGLHARRHEATLRLNSAETNLSRVVEVLTQLEAREATLRREADRAERYRSLSKELRISEAILQFRRWRDADREAAQAKESIGRTASDAGQAAQAASEAARRRAELEEALPKRREEEAIARAVQQKLEIERRSLDAREAESRRESFRRAAERLAAQAEDLAKDSAREAAICTDARDMLTRIEAEAATLATEDGAADAARAAIDDARTAETRASEQLKSAEAALDRLNADAARQAAERDGAAARLRELAQTTERLTREASEAEERLADLAGAQEEAGAAVEEAAAAREEAALAVEEADEAAADAEEARQESEARASHSRAARGEIDGRVKALRAEADQLARVVEARRSAARPVLDQLSGADGLEAALGAALGDDLKAGLEEDGADGPRWRALGALEDAPALPGGAPPLSAAVQGPVALDRRLAQIGLVDAADGAALQASLRPGQRLVSRDGDVWRWDGYVARAADAPSAAALELAQRNRLDALRTELDEAEAALSEAVEAEATAKEDAAAAATRDGEARERRRAAERAVSAAAAAAAQAENALAELRAKQTSISELLAARQRDLKAAEAAREEAAATLEAMTEAGAEGADLDAAKDAARETVEAARSAAMEARGARESLERQASERRERLAGLERDRDSWVERLAAAERQSAALAARAEEARAELEVAKAAPEEIAERREALAENAEAAEQRLVAAVEALTAAEAEAKEVAKAEREAEGKLAEAREGRARLEAKAEAAEERAEELRGLLRETAGCEPEAFLEKLELDPETLPLVKDLERSIIQLRQSREKLGAVNLRAAQELEEVSAERSGLSRERDDLEAAIAKLRQGVAALNREGRERLIAAFEEVNRTFTSLFTHLFDGGDARLVLVDSDDPLEAGLDLVCSPPGKTLRSLSLLSGGEQTLTAIALIFAVFMVNPAPICVLDEVDAPLDDANVTRFCDLLDEMTRRTKTRFLIITHHAVSMSRMDRLFGVTMVEKGVSQLVSVDLSTAVDMVNA